jgi:DNA (cytosine-5)-methyltransferase 1
METVDNRQEQKSGLTTVGLFAGIGGLEKGLSEACHKTILLVEIDEAANAVLKAQFPKIRRRMDVRKLKALPKSTELLVAGFPCQDLSQAGRTDGIHDGKESSLISNVFRLLYRNRVPWVLLENVPFMLQLAKGEAIRHIVDEFERLGYAWAYRTIDTRAFGIPQRRERVFLLASRQVDPAGLLFRDTVTPDLPKNHDGLACGFYWTEGNTGLGWAVDAIPTLKGGSAIGIPSPPAIWHPDGIFIPDIADAERLQGFPAGWTDAAMHIGKGRYRWKLVGNAVSVPAAAWLGSVLNSSSSDLPNVVETLAPKGAWPAAAFGSRRGRFHVEISTWPVCKPRVHLADFLQFRLKPLSAKATKGFVTRLKASTLRHPPEFMAALEAHLNRAENGQLETSSSLQLEVA